MNASEVPDDTLTIPSVSELLLIEPDRLYSPVEVAVILRMEPRVGDVKKRKRAMANRVYEIDPRELVKTRMGAKGGRTMYWGRDVLQYIEGRRAA